MNKKILLYLSALFFFLCSPAYGVDSLLNFPIDSAMQNGEVKDALRKNVAIYWGDQATPAVTMALGTFKTSKRTNGLMKPKQEACEWALASALVTLQDRALREGGNAIINVSSNINNNTVSSQTHFDCLVGSVMVNVALSAQVVQLAN